MASIAKLMAFVMVTLLGCVLATAMFTGWIVWTATKDIASSSATQAISAFEFMRNDPPQSLGKARFSAELRSRCGEARWMNDDDLGRIASCLSHIEARLLCSAEDRQSLRLLFGSYFERRDPRKPSRQEQLRRMLSDEQDISLPGPHHAEISAAHILLVRRGVIPKSDIGPGAPAEARGLMVQEVQCL